MLHKPQAISRMEQTRMRNYGPHLAAVLVAGMLASCSSIGLLPGVDMMTTSSIPSQPAPASNTAVQAYAPMQETAVNSEDFSAFVVALWPEARAKGVSRRMFDAAFSGVTPDPKVIALTRRQSEFVKPVWDYIASATSAQRLERGRDQTVRWRDTFAAVERTYGVDKRVVAGIWGMETNFGSTMGNNYVIRALSTLANARYRGTFFRDELLTALVILEQGHTTPDKMIGSWAGAMGQTQFMPSSFMRMAVDFSGDGKRDIWNSVPDALGSTGNYLRENGWQAGLPWGFEVRLPTGHNYGVREAAFSRWAAAGVRRMDGKPMPAGGEARIFMPAGARGPVFLVTKNFDVIKRYNNSDSYALGVALLGDMIHGSPGVQAPWPTDEKPLSRNEREQLQRSLARLGYSVGEPDGRIGSQTRAAIIAYQESKGLIPDGYANTALLGNLQRNL